MTERDGSSGTGSSKPPRKPQDSWKPAPAPSNAGSIRPVLTRASKGRLTLDFSGPLLALPDEAPSGGTPTGGTPTEAAPSPASHDPEWLEDTQPLTVPADDAWTTDRAARGTPAATPGRGVSVSSIPTPGRKRSSSPPRMSAGLSSEHDGDALGLVDRSRAAAPEIDLVGEMEERYALGDFTGALRAAELVLGQKPGDADAQRYARSSRERLEQLYSSRLGRLDLVPELALADRNIRWLGLDHRAAFLLSRIDGMHSIEELLDVSGMPRLETLKTLAELLDQKAIRFTDRG